MKKKEKSIKNSQNVDKDIIAMFDNMRKQLSILGHNLDILSNEYEYPHLVSDIKREMNKGKIKQITTSWVQKKYKFGFARAVNLIHKMKENKEI